MARRAFAAHYRRTPPMVRMNWLARRRLSAGLRTLGHSPQWDKGHRQGHRRFRRAYCADCGVSWVDRHTRRRDWLAAKLDWARPCSGRAR